MEELIGFTREMAVLLLLFTGLRALWHVGIPTYLGGELGCLAFAAAAQRRPCVHGCALSQHVPAQQFGVALARRSPAALPPLPLSSWPARP